MRGQLRRFFEDTDCTIFHNCPALHQNNKQQYADHVLLTSTISRVSELERKYKELSKKVEYKIDP